jgi:hypothetical protein
MEELKEYPISVSEVMRSRSIPSPPGITDCLLRPLRDGLG